MGSCAPAGHAAALPLAAAAAAAVAGGAAWPCEARLPRRPVLRHAQAEAKGSREGAAKPGPGPVATWAQAGGAAVRAAAPRGGGGRARGDLGGPMRRCLHTAAPVAADGCALLAESRAVCQALLCEHGNAPESPILRRGRGRVVPAALRGGRPAPGRHARLRRAGLGRHPRARGGGRRLAREGVRAAGERGGVCGVLAPDLPGCAAAGPGARERQPVGVRQPRVPLPEHRRDRAPHRPGGHPGHVQERLLAPAVRRRRGRRPRWRGGARAPPRVRSLAA
ncbi:unnamed protein product [Prorocentrum cordatum]|uniref:Uncharacterized protein n=1 Tax=Prorocentrum cordatum TaxID=2364126 RepID=A0ABN9REB3_9DINO|nr:unnamed protein product [Polarella glacialis]